MAQAIVEIRIADTAEFRVLLRAVADLVEVAETAAGSLEVSENYETPRYVAEELRDAVNDFREALGAI